MRAPVERMALVPRFTSLYGAIDMYTSPLNVSRYSMALLTLWRSGGLEGTATVTVQLQQSTDLRIWEDVGGTLTTSVDVQTTVSRDLDLEWIRLKITPSSASLPGTTMWVVGEFVPREEGGKG